MTCIHASASASSLCTDCEQFSEGTYDVGIVQAWWLDEIATDVETHHLRYERLAPACSSAFARQSPKLRKPTDLRNKTLLHALDTKDWEAWLGAVGEHGVPILPEPVYRSGDAAARAAMSGKGIAIIDIDLYKYELDSGRLVTPFDFVLSNASPLVFFCVKGRREETNIALFLAWLEEALKTGR